MLYEIVCAEEGSYVERVSYVVSVFDNECSVCDFNFAGPFGLVACYLNLCALFELSVVSFGASHVVEEVCAVLILCVNGSLVFPPGLLSLNVCFDGNFCVEVSRDVFRIGHNAFALYVSVVC